MGRSARIDYRAAIENNLSGHPDGLSLDELLEQSELNVDRSTLFRHLARLIDMGRIERIGKARASRYRPLNTARIDAQREPSRAQDPDVQPIPKTAEHEPRNETPDLAADENHQLQHTAGPEHDAALTPDDGKAVKKAVRTVVRDWKRYDEINLRIYLSLIVERERVEELAAAVNTELAGLHEGNLDGYGLSPAEFSRFIAAPTAKRPALREP